MKCLYIGSDVRRMFPSRFNICKPSAHHSFAIITLYCNTLETIATMLCSSAFIITVLGPVALGAALPASVARQGKHKLNRRYSSKLIFGAGSSLHESAEMIKVRAEDGDPDEAVVYAWSTSEGETVNGAKSRRAEEGDADEAVVYAWSASEGDMVNGAKLH